ncbi:hypothetical protein ABLA37_22545 [Vibrio parahaemolyticus]
MDEQKVIMHISMVKEFIDNCELTESEKFMVAKGVMQLQETANEERQKAVLLQAHIDKNFR